MVSESNDGSNKPDSACPPSDVTKDTSEENRCEYTFKAAIVDFDTAISTISIGELDSSPGIISQNFEQEGGEKDEKKRRKDLQSHDTEIVINSRNHPLQFNVGDSSRFFPQSGKFGRSQVQISL